MVKGVILPSKQKRINGNFPTVLRKQFWGRLNDFEVPPFARKWARRSKQFGRRFPTSKDSRLHLLQKMAEVKVHRKYAGKVVRDTFEKGPAVRRKCFVCGLRAYAWHHVIQVQNGGTNHRGNLVPLCEMCHAEVHPWLEVEMPEARQLDAQFAALCG
jgi:5-methylcytosine-specific restriction endonuclease McrA